jgi:vitamin B12 transporter
MRKNKTAIAFALVCSASVLPVFADDNVVVVTANRFEQDVNNLLLDVQMIERADIERLQPQSLVELLVNIAGVDFTQSGGHGQDASVFVRGTNSNQILVLVDGIRVGSATLGNKAVSTIPVAQIERIEIVKGPRAAIWGSDAIGGVIQIFTRRYQSGEYRVALTAGSNATRELEASVGMGNASVSNTITYSVKESDGFDVRIGFQPDEDGYDHESVSLRGDYKVSDSSVLDWLVQADEGKNEFDSFFGSDFNRFKNHLYSLRYSLQDEVWNHQFSVNGSKDYANDFETRRQQLSYLARNQLSSTWSFSSGVDLYKDDVSKSVTSYNEEERTTKSVFVSFNNSGEQFLADLAIRYDDVENVATETTSNVALGWRIAAGHLLSLNYAEGFKAPTFNDLYFPFGGNPDLRFEISTNHELIYKGQVGDGRLSVSVYDSSIENLIQWIPDSNGIWAPQNVGQADISGVDLNYHVSYADFTHKFSADQVDAKDGVSGQRLIRRAKNHLGYELGYSGDAFEWFMQLQWVGERPDLDYQTFAPINLDSYTRVNLGVAYLPNQKLKIQLKVNDAFDEAPTIVSGYFPVEREVYLTVSYQDLQ